MVPYKRVAAELRRRIIDGEYRQGTQLPSLPALCADFGVSKATVTRALAVLRDEEHLIVYEPGWGHFVS